MESNSDPAIIVNLHHVTCGKLAMMTSFRFREVHALTLKSVVNKRTLFHFSLFHSVESNSDPAIIVTCGKLAMMTSFRFREVHALTLKSVVNKRTLFHF